MVYCQGLIQLVVLFIGYMFIKKYKMNEAVNKFLLAGDRFIPDKHLKQLGFTQSTCERFTKSKERIQEIKETGDSKYIY